MSSESSELKLYRTWTLWYLIPDRYQIRGNDWTDYLHTLNTFDTVEDMWATLNAVGRAPQLPKGSRFYLFKRGVRPLWEDPANTGGRLVSIEHQIANAKKAKINDRWIDLVLAVLGESMENSGVVNGVEFTVRKGTYNICLWLAPCKDDVAAVIERELGKIVNWKSPIKVTKITAS